MTIRALLNDRVQQAMQAAGLPADCEPHLAPSKNPAFGDYQANGIMGAAKKRKANPRQLAESVLEHLHLDDLAEEVTIAGPGFINIRLQPAWLGQQLLASPPTENLAQHQPPQTIVVDYSGPNLAKEMHVGHLRSTIIGDAIAKVLESLGHQVVRQNHVGDWGTQFGMLIAELESQLVAGEPASLALQDLESFYQKAKRHFDEDAAFAAKARDYVVRLQSGDAELLALWQEFRDISLKHCEEIYQLLNVSLKPEDVRGESAYNSDLAVLVEELQTRGLAVTDQGAQVVFLEELADKKGNPSPVIVQKQGGGFLYATSDLAALRYRANALHANRIMVFSDARQCLHMQQVYTLARKAEFVPTDVRLEHHPFGTMMGADGKPFKTRTGGTVKLADLIREGISRAEGVVRSKNPTLSPAQTAEVARKVGIGAIKYADLSKTRTHDYVFDWDQMLSFEGNTGPYLQYAYTRIRSVFRKAECDPEQLLEGSINPIEPQERALALKLLQLNEVVHQVAEDAYPHLLCNYLYDVASLFMSFYEACPILKDTVTTTERASRLLMCQRTAETIRLGLGLLGIEVMEQM